MSIDRETDGAVLQVLESPLDPGVEVRGQVDWARRFDHMQQHTGQHVLSAAFVRLFEMPTVSFHLGTAASTIDLAGRLDRTSSRARKTKQTGWSGRTAPVTVQFVTADEAARLPLRKEPVRGGTLRMVDVEEFDLSACGGTHVPRTGAIGAIVVLAWERYKGGTRVSFVCGGRAVTAFHVLRDVVAATVRQLSIPADRTVRCRHTPAGRGPRPTAAVARAVRTTRLA